MLLGAFTALAAATFPDIDHPQSTVSRVFGPLSRLGAVAASTVSGGHRQGVHSLLGTTVAFLLAVAAVRAGGWWVVGLLAIIFGVGFAAVGHKRAWLAGAILVGAAFTTVGDVAITALPVHVLPVAILCGWLAHLVGDDLTHSRVRWLWPLQWRRPKWFTITTGGAWERWLIMPACGVVATVLLMDRVGLTPYVRLVV